MKTSGALLCAFVGIASASTIGMGGVGTYSDKSFADPVLAVSKPLSGGIGYFRHPGLRPSQDAFGECHTKYKNNLLLGNSMPITSERINAYAPVFIKNVHDDSKCISVVGAHFNDNKIQKCVKFVARDECLTAASRLVSYEKMGSLKFSVGKGLLQKGCFYSEKSNQIQFIYSLSAKDLKVVEPAEDAVELCVHSEHAPADAIRGAIYNLDADLMHPIAGLMDYRWDPHTGEVQDGSKMTGADLLACKQKQGGEEEGCNKPVQTVHSSNYFFNAFQFLHNAKTGECDSDDGWCRLTEVNDGTPLSNSNKLADAENSAVIGGRDNYLGSRFSPVNPVAEVDPKCTQEREQKGECQTEHHAHPSAFEFSSNAKSVKASFAAKNDNPSAIKGRLFIASRLGESGDKPDLSCTSDNDCVQMASHNWRCIKPDNAERKDGVKLGAGHCREFIMNSAVVGGEQNRVAAHQGVIIGGFRNEVLGNMGVVVGGTHNTAGGLKSVALGSNAKALGDNSLVMGFKQQVIPMEKWEQRFLTPTSINKYHFNENGHCEKDWTLRFEDFYRTTISDPAECQRAAEQQLKQKKITTEQFELIFAAEKDTSKPVGEQYKPAPKNNYREIGEGVDDVGYDTPCGGYLCKAEQIFWNRYGYVYKPKYDPSHPHTIEACTVHVPEETNRDGKMDVFYQSAGAQLRNPGTSGKANDFVKQWPGPGPFKETFKVSVVRDSCEGRELGTCSKSGDCCSLTPDKDGRAVLRITRQQNGRNIDSDKVNEVNQWPEGMELRCRYTDCASKNSNGDVLDNSITMCSEHFTITGDLQVGETKFSEYYNNKKKPTDKALTDLVERLNDPSTGLLAKAKNYERRLRQIQYKIDVEKDNLYERLLEQKHEHDILISWMKLDMKALGYDPDVKGANLPQQYTDTIKALDQLRHSGSRWYATEGADGK